MERNAERCVSCGATIPEGRMVCPGCEEAARAKAKIEALQMDKEQLQSDIINANQNFDHIKELWEKEKEKVAFAKQKLIKACRDLQTAKAENEELVGNIDRLKAELFDKTEHLKTAEAEIERLKEDNEIKSSKRANIFEIVNAFERGKAEAYKECIDKIQNQIKNNNAISAEWLRKYLDNLLQELVGDTDV